MGFQYYYLKIYDFLDTIFFVLRKKYNQVTFLHMYHHIGMVYIGLMTMKYAPVAQGVMVITLNCIVHSIMYFYYLLACINTDYKKSVWWKKYITQIQMVQFIISTIHFMVPILDPRCTYPMLASIIFVPQNVFIFYMFAKFYVKSYIKKNQ
ncbi:very long chain fatty acid elongase 2-like [Arctopsyche grandis]|uniref:very long chain fatty acid elongase 2-like n=1 Tax=Arctopsyche grandis TaxID=121162 RepID=UPI00406D7196